MGQPCSSSSRLAIRMEKCELFIVGRVCGDIFSEVAFPGSPNPRVCANRIRFVWRLAGGSVFRSLIRPAMLEMKIAPPRQL